MDYKQKRKIVDEVFKSYSQAWSGYETSIRKMLFTAVNATLKVVDSKNQNTV